jgi:hypothetical protein
MFRLTRVIVRLLSEPLGFSSIITYSYRTVTEQLQDSYRTITEQLQNSYRTVTEQLQNSYRTVTGQLQNSYRTVTGNNTAKTERF